MASFEIQDAIDALELDREDIVELLQDLRAYILEEIPKLEKAVRGNQIEACRDLAHAMKGSFGNLRVNTVFKTTKLMQDAADKEDMNLIKELYEQLKIEVDEFLEDAEKL